MRSLIVLTAAAPLALLAGCGDSTPAENAEPTPMPTDSIAAAEPEPMPTVPADALANVDYSGAYTQSEDNGSTGRLTLNADSDSYDYTAADGSETSGNYTEMDDGRRIMIEDFDGRPAYFAIADGAIYRLPEADSSPDDITVTGMYRRDFAPVPPHGPDASVNSVADKRE